MQLKEWVNTNRELFTESDLRFLLKEIFSSSNSLFYEKDIFLDEGKISSLEQAKQMYVSGLPMAYILGKEEFFGLKFKVNPHVLVPRKETELIVEKAADIIKKYGCLRILDLGCGSANIAITLEKLIGKNAYIFASDISWQALTLAQANRALHKSGIKLINTDLFAAFKHHYFELIVSNPPYVKKQDIRGSLQYEPKIALDAGLDGLSVIRAVLGEAYLYIKAGGHLIMEIGYNQKEPIEQILEKMDRYEIIEWIKDYDGNWRGVILKTSKPQIPNYKQITNPKAQ